MASATDRSPLPLTVIGGFLGAGKTTLLNRLLRESDRRRLAVLVNDFGSLNIDAELIQSTASDTIALTNGCVCCSIGDDLTTALINVLESATLYDAVVIEASGVSDPWRIAQVARAEPALTLDSVIVLVDASAVLAQSRDPLLIDTLERQMKAADLIVVNHCDHTSADERIRVSDWITSIAGPTPQFEATQARVPLPMLSSSALPTARSAAPMTDEWHRHAEEALEHAHNHEDPGHGALFDTWSCRPPQVFSTKALRMLLRDMPAGVLRLKGILRTDEHDWAELQFAGRHGSLRKAHAVPATGAAIVAIGLRQRFPVQALESIFDGDALGS